MQVAVKVLRFVSHGKIYFTFTLMSAWGCYYYKIISANFTALAKAMLWIELHQFPWPTIIPIPLSGLKPTAYHQHSQK